MVELCTSVFAYKIISTELSSRFMCIAYFTSILKSIIRTALDYVVMKNLLMAASRRQLSHTSFKDIMEQLQSSEQPIIIKILLEKNAL